jgi:hypothetical protein
MHNFVDLFYAYCMLLKSINTRKTCLLSSLPRPPPLFCLTSPFLLSTVHLPVTEDTARLPGSGKNLGPVDPNIMG